MNIRAIITVPRQRLVYRVTLFGAWMAFCLQWTFLDKLPAGASRYFVDAFIAIVVIMVVFPCPGGMFPRPGGPGTLSDGEDLLPSASKREASK